MAKLASFVAFVLLVVSVASFASGFAPGYWYLDLPKPDWTPGSWIFLPVWSVLYACIAVAGWLAWCSGRAMAPLAFWGIGLLLNGAWSWLFFGLHRIDLAMIDLVALWGAIIGFVTTVRRQSQVAALLFLPYLVWVTYVAVLTFAIWRMAV